MRHVLVISSFVAGSNVGGSLAIKALPQLGCEVSLLPTTLLGRHPGWGMPGGGAVPDVLFSGMADGLEANDIPAQCDTVITGYFATAAQVKRVSRLIRKHCFGRAMIIVDPIMGDDGKGLYVPEEVAQAIRDDLVPLADVITPNKWEADWLGDEIEATQFVTSVRRDGLIGISGPDGMFEGTLERDPEEMPNGTGDLATLLIALQLMDRPIEQVDLRYVVDIISRQIDRAQNGELPGVVQGF